MAPLPRPERHPFTLAIDALDAELAELRCPGGYLLLAEREASLQRLAAGLLTGLGHADHADWISVSAPPAPPGLEDPARGPRRLRLWSLPAQRRALLALPDELPPPRRRERGHPRLLALWLPAARLEALDAASLNDWLRRWRRWCATHRACLVLLAHGALDATGWQRLVAGNHWLDGLAQLLPAGRLARYRTAYWRNARFAGGEQERLLQAEGNGWQCVATTDVSRLAPHDDESRLLAQRAALRGATLADDRWQLFDSPEALLAAALDARAATVLLALESIDQLEAVAARVHQLRRRCGSALKLVVRETTPCLRYHDERLLVLSGASLIVGHGLGLSGLLNRLEAVQGQRFLRPVDPDFPAIVAALRPLAVSGVVAPATLIEQLQAWLSRSAAEAIASLLVILTPNPGVAPRQALARCRLHRPGDAVTLIDSRLYLFLGGCRRTDLDPLLARLFEGAERELFAQRQVLDQPDALALELAALRDQGWTQIVEAPTPLAATPGAQPASAALDAHAPQRVSLVLTTDREPTCPTT